jgi:chemotaxis protein histidine kinase CheA
MNEDENQNNLKKLAQELSLSKKIFRNYSYQLQQDNINQGVEILRQLHVMRNGINETLNRLTVVVKNVLDKIGSAWQKLYPFMDNFTEAGYISWLIGLITCASTLVVTLFLIVPLSCACCHVDNLAGITFQMSACVLSIFSIFLGFFTIFEVLIGAHGEVFVCRALYEEPEYAVVGKLFDNPGIIYKQPLKNGIFTELLTPNDSQSEKAFANTSLTRALSECENNKSSYSTFQIDNLLDLKNVLNYENYLDLVKSMNGIKAHDAPFTGFTEKIQTLLNNLMHDSDLNFTQFRLEILQISPEKEMINFIDQMQRVSMQISDVTTATRMSTLAQVARRFQFTVLQPLEILKNEIIFQLTALELQIVPWMKSIRNTQDSLNNTQVYLDNNAFEICRNFSENYRNRLKSAMQVFRNDSLHKLEHEFGCKSLFDTFDGLRLLTCGHIIEPINGKKKKNYFFILCSLMLGFDLHRKN